MNLKPIQPISRDTAQKYLEWKGRETWVRSIPVDAVSGAPAPAHGVWTVAVNGQTIRKSMSAILSDTPTQFHALPPADESVFLMCDKDGLVYSAKLTATALQERGINEHGAPTDTGPHTPADQDASDPRLVMDEQTATQWLSTDADRSVSVILPGTVDEPSGQLTYNHPKRSWMRAKMRDGHSAFAPVAHPFDVQVRFIPTPEDFRLHIPWGAYGQVQPDAALSESPKVVMTADQAVVYLMNGHSRRVYRHGSGDLVIMSYRAHPNGGCVQRRAVGGKWAKRFTILSKGDYYTDLAAVPKGHTVVAAPEPPASADQTTDKYVDASATMTATEAANYLQAHEDNRVTGLALGVSFGPYRTGGRLGLQYKDKFGVWHDMHHSALDDSCEYTPTGKDACNEPPGKSAPDDSPAQDAPAAKPQMTVQELDAHNLDAHRVATERHMAALSESSKQHADAATALVNAAEAIAASMAIIAQKVGQ